MYCSALFCVILFYTVFYLVLTVLQTKHSKSILPNQFTQNNFLSLQNQKPIIGLMFQRLGLPPNATFAKKKLFLAFGNKICLFLFFIKGIYACYKCKVLPLEHFD